MATLGDRQGTVSYAKSVAPGSASGNQAVRVDYAPGMVLGPDGFFHPLEQLSTGEMKVVDGGNLTAADESLLYLRAMAYGIAQLCGMSLDDLLDTATSED